MFIVYADIPGTRTRYYLANVTISNKSDHNFEKDIDLAARFKNKSDTDEAMVLISNIYQRHNADFGVTSVHSDSLALHVNGDIIRI